MAGVCWASSRPGTSPLSRRAAWPRSSTSGTGWRSGAGKQGSRMSAGDDELEHVVVVPGGLLAPAAQAGPAAAVLGDQVEGDLAQQGEVAGGGAVPHPAVVLAEGDVQDPVQPVLHAPVPPDRPRQDGGIVAAAGQEVAELGLDLVGPGDAADRLHRQHGVEVGPVAQGFETLCRRVQEDAPADQAAVALLEGVEHRPAAGPAAEAGALEVLAYRLEGAAVVGLERQEVVGVPGPDPLGGGLLAAHRVQRDDAALEPQGVGQLRDRRDLVRLAVDRALAERQPALARPGADQVQRPALVAAAAGPADGLAVDRDHLALGPDRQRLRPAAEAGLERVRVDQHEDPSERVVRGDAVRQLEEGLEPGPLAPPVELDVLPALGAGDHGTDRDREDVDQLVIAPARLAGIAEPGEARRQTFHHAARPPSWRTENDQSGLRSALDPAHA